MYEDTLILAKILYIGIFKISCYFWVTVDFILYHFSIQEHPQNFAFFVSLNDKIICVWISKSYDDKEREKAQEKGDKKQIFKYSAESDKSTKLMEDLKLRCDQTKEKVQ